MRKFEKELNEIKNNLNNYKLSEEFKNNLKEKMDAELMNDEIDCFDIDYNDNIESSNINSDKFKIFSKIKDKFVNNSFSLKLVSELAVFCIILSSCFVFADGIESWVINNFSNIDKKLDKAIENGNYKEINMDYVEKNGVSIKVDYIVIEEDSLYVCFNVLTEEEFDKIYFENIEIKNENIELSINNLDFEYMDKIITNKNINLIYKIIYDNLNNLDGQFEINTYKIKLKQNEDIYEVNDNWNFSINY